jgi:long-chain acyl-CoA synthetase
MKPTLEFETQHIEAEDFFQRYQRAAVALRAAGVGEGDVVALLMRNGPDLLELMLAARWIGALWCPINWHFKADEVQYILSDSGAKVLIADTALLDALLAGPAGLKLDGINTFVTARHGESSALPRLPGWAEYRDALTALTTPNLAASAPRGAMFYTSGTTGKPKGIRRAPSTPEQAARGLEVLRHCLGFEPGMRALLNAPIYHSAPNSYSIGSSLDSAHLFIQSHFDAEDTLRMIAQHGITHAYLVPTMFVRMLRLPASVRAQYDLTSIRFVASTGSPCPPDVKRAMIEWWGPVIYESYGASELGYMTRLDSHEALRKPGSAGKPLPGVTLAILDKQGEPLPQGAAGLIYVHQSAYADFTYIGNDAARQKMEHKGLKTLGDIGYLDEDGYLFIVDRSADLVISGGVNIYPAEIEAALQMMPGVVDCAVFGIPDAEFGEALACAVQTSRGTSLDAEDVQAFLKSRLATYKVPKTITFHAEMPREDTGKIFKRKLREPYWVGQARRV